MSSVRFLTYVRADDRQATEDAEDAAKKGFGKLVIEFRSKRMEKKRGNEILLISERQ
jgi:hypothetical protein